MTTKNSPIAMLRKQADKIAATLKAAERGEAIDARFAERIAAARGKDNIKIGIVMDDKIVTIELPWTVISGTSEAGISEYVLSQMREIRRAIK